MASEKVQGIIDQLNTFTVLEISELSKALQEAWGECQRGMYFAINFLKNNAGIESPAVLSSPFILVSLGYYGHKQDYEIALEEAQRLAAGDEESLWSLPP